MVPALTFAELFSGGFIYQGDWWRMNFKSEVICLAETKKRAREREFGKRQFRKGAEREGDCGDRH